MNDLLTDDQVLSAWERYCRLAWGKPRLRYQLHDAQKIIYDSVRSENLKNRQVVIVASRRFGKSFLGNVLAVEDCIRFPNKAIRIVGQDIATTEEIVSYNLNKIINDAPHGLIKRTSSKYMWEIGSSQLIIEGFNTINIKKHRGKESQSIYIEETGTTNPDQYRYIIRDVLTPQLLHTRGHMFHLTTLPPVPGHPFETETIPEAQAAGSYFEFNIYQNPLLTLEDIEQAKKDCGGENSTTFLREYMCQSVRDEMITVYPEFNEDNVQEFAIPEHSRYLSVVDFGGIRDKTGALLMTYDFRHGTDLVLDEVFLDRNTSTETIINAILDMERKHLGSKQVDMRYGDASGQTSVDAFTLFGFNFSPPIKEDKDSAVNAVRIRLGERKVLIHPRCKFLIQTLKSQIYNDTRTDFLRTELLGHNDLGMAFVYGLRMLDRTTNPYPSPIINKETNWSYLKKEAESVSMVASAIQPKRFGAFK